MTQTVVILTNLPGNGIHQGRFPAPPLALHGNGHGGLRMTNKITQRADVTALPQQIIGQRRLRNIHNIGRLIPVSCHTHPQLNELIKLS